MELPRKLLLLPDCALQPSLTHFDLETYFFFSAQSELLADYRLVIVVFLSLSLSLSLLAGHTQLTVCICSSCSIPK